MYVILACAVLCSWRGVVGPCVAMPAASITAPQLQRASSEQRVLASLTRVEFMNVFVHKVGVGG